MQQNKCVLWNRGWCADWIGTPALSESRGWQRGGCTRCRWIVGSVYCTLQLHLPVRSAQAHTCLSRSQVWLSDPATLHSHWVHCGECLGRRVGGREQQHQASVITSKAGIEEPAECVLALCFTKPMKSKIKMLCYSDVRGENKSAKFRQTQSSLFSLSGWSIRVPRMYFY